MINPPEPTPPEVPSTPQQEQDLRWMRRALALAERAGALGEVPVGAVVVDAAKDLELGAGFNRREVDRDPLSHAELSAIAAASKAIGAWRLSDLTLYVTLEPCAMCAGAMVQSRLKRVVFGATDPKAGAAGSLYDLLAEPRHNWRPEVTRGVLEAESSAMLKEFFRALRERPPG